MLPGEFITSLKSYHQYDAIGRVDSLHAKYRFNPIVNMSV